MSTEPIATRDLDLVQPDGSSATVKVEVFAPAKEATPEGGERYGCAFNISGLASPIEMKGYGVDSMQALKIALEFIATRLCLCREAREGRLTFEGEGGPFGFPLPEEMRDLPGSPEAGA